MQYKIMLDRNSYIHIYAKIKKKKYIKKKKKKYTTMILYI